MIKRLIYSLQFAFWTFKSNMKGGGNMSAVYAILIIQGLWTIGQTFEKDREDTIKACNALGYDEYGNKLTVSK